MKNSSAKWYSLSVATGVTFQEENFIFFIPSSFPVDYVSGLYSSVMVVVLYDIVSTTTTTTENNKAKKLYFFLFYLYLIFPNLPVLLSVRR